MIRYSVIGGYLGAGKTTLLNRILQYNQDIRFGLIVNDFGALNIDAELIESKTDSQVNLTNGCVCCTLVDGFHEALETVAATKPDHIIVEASGVADVANIAQYGHGPDLVLDSVLVLADVETIQKQAKDKYVARTVQRQLQSADLIVLNKCDLVTTERQQAVEAWLPSVAPDVKVLPASHGDVPIQMLLGTHDDSISVEHDHVDHETYATWQFQLSQAIERSGCQVFLEQLPDFVLRAKGFVAVETGETLELQVVGKRKTLVHRPDGHKQRSTPVSLVAIGLAVDFDVKVLDRLADEYLVSVFTQ